MRERVMRGLVIVGMTAVLAPAVWLACPLPSAVADAGPVPSVVIEDRRGLVLRTTRSAEGERGGWVSLSACPAPS